METSLEHNNSLVLLASELCGLTQDQILKTRETPDGGLVVIDQTGSKRTFDSLQLAQHLQQVVNARRVQAPPVFLAVSRRGGARPGAGRKPNQHGGARPNAGRKRIQLDEGERIIGRVSRDYPPAARNEP